MRQCELEEEYTADVVIKRSEHVFTEMHDIKDWDKEVFVTRKGFFSFKDHGRM